MKFQHTFSTPARRVALLSISTSAGLAGLSLILLLVGTVIQRWPASTALVFAGFAVPVVALFLFATRPARADDWARAASLSFVGGLVALINAIVNLISAAYANPCFEVANCTKGPTFPYVALGVVALIFAVVAVLGIAVIPVAAGFAARHRHRAPLTNHP